MLTQTLFTLMHAYKQKEQRQLFVLQSESGLVPGDAVTPTLALTHRRPEEIRAASLMSHTLSVGQKP